MKQDRIDKLFIELVTFLNKGQSYEAYCHLGSQPIEDIKALSNRNGWIGDEAFTGGDPLLNILKDMDQERHHTH